MAAATRSCLVISERASLTGTGSGPERVWTDAGAAPSDDVPLPHAQTSSAHSANADELAARMTGTLRRHGRRRHGPARAERDGVGSSSVAIPATARRLDARI